MVKNTVKKYDKHRENYHEQVCAVLQRQRESRQKCSAPKRMRSAAWGMVLNTARAPSSRGIPCHEFTGSRYSLAPSGTITLLLSHQPTLAPIWPVLQLWNAKDTMQWRGKPCKNHQCCYLLFSKVRVRVVALCCSPTWHRYFCELSFLF